jgi:hypothetical protein
MINLLTGEPILPVRRFIIREQCCPGEQVVWVGHGHGQVG